MTSNEELIQLIQAEIDGKTVLVETSTGCWRGKNAGWNSTYDYRIKPEPREWYVNEYPEHLGYKGFGYLHPTREIAGKHGDRDVVRVIHVKEVLK